MITVYTMVEIPADYFYSSFLVICSQVDISALKAGTFVRHVTNPTSKC